MIEDTKLFLEKIYQEHHQRGERYGYLVCHGQRKRYIPSWIEKGKKVLDLGCRDGELTKSFIQGNKVTGADIDRIALSLTEKRLGIETVWIDLNHQWPFKKESFDVILCCEILEHLLFIEPILEKIYDSLTPGGQFIGSVPNSFRMRNRMKFLQGKEFDRDPTHLHRFSYEKLHALLGKYFKEFSIIPLQGKILPFLRVSEKTPRFLNRLFSRMFLWRAKKEER